MAESLMLPGDTRDFFSLVKKAALANPFDKERPDLDRKIAGPSARVGDPAGIEKTVEAVEAGLKALEKGGRLDVDAYQGEDRNLVESALWFLFFYRFRKKFDVLIRSQIKADEKPGRLGGGPVKVPFAAEAFSFLARHGFGEARAKSMFELCYQVRRAYFFLNHTLKGRSPAMQRLRQDVWNTLFTHNLELYSQFLWDRMEDFSTLLLGETGTGKGTVAAAIGRSGHIPYDMKKGRFAESFTKSFVAINMNQFPESLIESELFGHKKGAFTGAMDNYDGVFSRCGTHGAILLDEIGDISLPVQIKLLQVLQERVFFPVGSHKAEKFQGRVIAATNQSIQGLRKAGKFRDDFYYRLCSDIIVVPSLRERLAEDPGELGELLSFMVIRMVGKPSPELCGMVGTVIAERLGPDYPWYGNVRELEQCVRSVLLKKSYEGDERSGPTDLRASLAEALDRGDIPAHRLLAGYCKLLHGKYGTFEEVARRTRLDRRTVTKYIHEWDQEEPQ